MKFRLFCFDPVPVAGAWRRDTRAPSAPQLGLRLANQGMLSSQQAGMKDGKVAAITPMPRMQQPVAAKTSVK